MPKNAQTTVQLYSSHMSASNAENSPSQASTVCEPEIPDVQAGFRKGKEPKIKLSTFAGLEKKQERSRKTCTSALLTMPKPLTV